MRNFFMGLALGLLGFVVFYITAVLATMTNEELAGVLHGIGVIGVATMFLGIFVFWLVVPAAGWKRGRHRREEES